MFVNHSYTAIRKALDAGTLTLPELVLQYLAEIEKRRDLNAFLEVYTDEVLAEAERVQEKIQSGKAGRLAGMVLAVKDVICQKGHIVTASSRILGDFRSLFTATALQRLLDEDAIVIGRTNCDEFAMGSSNENSAFGPVHNPLAHNHVSGGSSGGSAAALAAGLCTASLGTETGGSVRQPASFCGVVGVKPTYARISRYGLIAYASSFDQIGPFTRTVEDAALLMEIMAGRDEMDNTSSTEVVGSYHFNDDDKGSKSLRLAVVKEALYADGLDPEIKARMEAIIEIFRSQGHTVDLVDFPLLDYLVPTYYVLTTAEASSNLARYDGIRFGYRSPDAKDLNDLYVRSRTEGFGEEVKRRIMLGTFVLSAGYYDAYYTRAQKVRRMLRDQTRAILANYDFLLSPTTPTTAFKIGEKSDDPVSMYLSDIYTVHANLAGNPAISIPAGKHSNGLPFGLHILAADFGEGRLLQFASQAASILIPVSV